MWAVHAVFEEPLSDAAVGAAQSALAGMASDGVGVIVEPVMLRVFGPSDGRGGGELMRRVLHQSLALLESEIDIGDVQVDYFNVNLHAVRPPQVVRALAAPKPRHLVDVCFVLRTRARIEPHCSRPLGSEFLDRPPLV